MREWRKVSFFEWRDGGPIELRFSDGTTVRGFLSFDSLDDEPVPEFEADDGRKFSVFDAEAWRPIKSI